MDDLIFQMEQRSNEVSYLHRKVDDLNRSSKVRKRKESSESNRALKRREPSRGDESSSPNIDTPTYDLRRQAAAWSIGGNVPTEPRIPPNAPRVSPFAPTVPSTVTRRTITPRCPLRRPDNRPEATILNGRPYEPATKVTPPGSLREEPNVLQRNAGPVEPPPPAEPDTGVRDEYYNFDESDEEEERPRRRGKNPPQPAEYEPNDDLVVPPFWGVVRVSDWMGIPGNEGYERNNSFRGMLSRHAYHSQRSNAVFVGVSAREAAQFEADSDQAYTPHGRERHHAYQVTRRGIPMTATEVRKLRTIARDSSRFSPRERTESFLLLRELYLISNRVSPENLDVSMRYILDPGRFSLEPPPYFPLRHLYDTEHSLSIPPPPRQQPTPPLEEAMNIDDAGLYLLHYNRPGSRNSVTGVAIDFAFRVGRRSVFGYALGRLLAPTNRDTLQAFRRQYALLVSLPRRYREAIVEYNRANPHTPFTAQIGPTYRIHRVRYDSTHSSNISMQDVILALIDNHIPPEWVDHAYPHGIIFLNTHYTGSSLSQDLLDAVDNERIARLH